MTGKKCDTLGELNGRWVVAFKVIMVFMTFALPVNMAHETWQTAQLIELREEVAVLGKMVCDPKDRIAIAKAIATIEATLALKGG